MRRILATIAIVGAALLSACGAASVQDTTNQAATAVNAPEAGTAGALVGTAVNAPEASTAEVVAATAVNAPEASTAEVVAATAVSAPEAGTAAAAAGDALNAAASDVTVQRGQALVLDATKSVGNIKDYKWTITKAPAGAESVVGQVITENSNGNVSLDPGDYAKYFPAAGDYTVQLTVTDTQGATSNDDFTVAMP